MARAASALHPEIFTDEKKLSFSNRRFEKSLQISDEKSIVDNYEKEVRALKNHFKMFDTLVTREAPVAAVDLPVIKRGTKEKSALSVNQSKSSEKFHSNGKSKNTKIRFQTKVEYHDKFNKFEQVGLPKAKLVRARSKEAEDITPKKSGASSNEVLHLKEKLKSLSTELLTLRHHLVDNNSTASQQNDTTMTVVETEKKDKKSTKQTSIIASGQPGDLIQLTGPLTEDAVVRALQARFYSGHCWTKIGTVLVSVNSYRDVGNPLTLTSMHRKSIHLLQIVEEAVRQQVETGYPQTIILGGDAGSGKTYSSMLLLRHLFDIAGGGPETDAFKHLSAALSVLRSLGTAKTATNSESSRLGHFIEVQVSDGAIHRTKIHCYFLDQSRVIHPLSTEKNYHIFYQMLAGLSTEERVKLHLEGYTIQNLVYLSQGELNQNEAQDKSRFKDWKTALSVLGIAFFDVMRVLSAVILLGNIQFIEGSGLELTIQGNNEIKSVAALLGVSSVALYRGLTIKTRNRRGHMIKTGCDAPTANMNRDALAKALYCRTVATIVRRANSLRRINSASLTLSSDSNESVHNQETVSQHSPSASASQSSRLSKSLNAYNSGKGFNSEGFIGIVDMFGFETAQINRLEQLCVNLTAETMQHIFNTHIFKSSIDSCKDEGIYCDVDVGYVDSVLCIELIASQKTGLLSLLDAESTVLRPNLDSFIQKIQTQLTSNRRFFNPASTSSPYQFGISHYRSKVVYDASEFMDCNRDIVPDDVVCVFQKQNCNFGFTTHLFASDLKNSMYEGSGPKGLAFRISPPSYSDSHHNTNENLPTFTQDFHTRLDNLLKTLMHSKSHFIRCIKSNDKEECDLFDREAVVKQIRALEVLETVNLMAGGFPHRMRLKAFNTRYRFFIGSRRLKKTEEGQYDDCRLILEHYLKAVDESSFPYTSNNWALGKKYIFLSEGARQQLELLRLDRRKKAAIIIQSRVRGWLCMKKWPSYRQSMEQKRLARSNLVNRPRPQPIVERSIDSERGDRKLLEQTCQMYGLDMNHIPPVPSSRPYIVVGNIKMGYPQTRIMKQNYPQHKNSDAVLHCGEAIFVIGASPKKGYIIVEHNNSIMHVPYQITELKTAPKIGVNI